MAAFRTGDRRALPEALNAIKGPEPFGQSGQPQHYVRFLNNWLPGLLPLERNAGHALPLPPGRRAGNALNKQIRMLARDLHGEVGFSPYGTNGMDNTTYIALSVQDALKRQMDIIAHNLANVQTGAFKSEKPLFIEVLDENSDIAYVEDYGVVRDMSAGHLNTTGSQLDIAVQGSAYLAVEVNGEIRYTRNGHLQLSADRELVTSTGYPVMDVDGRKIEIPPGNDNLTISPDGSLSGAIGPIARIDLVSFENPLHLQREANSLYIASELPIEPDNASLIQGALEDSNVKPIIEFTNMINVHRAYQMNSKLVETEHQLTMDTINAVIQA
jgi:flagellar basal-body rod protein FlgF